MVGTWGIGQSLKDFARGAVMVSAIIANLEDYLDMSLPTLLVADSCHCGLATLNNITHLSEGTNIIFLADYKYNPFGLKKVDLIGALVNDWIHHFSKYNLKELYIACNTASNAHRVTNRTSQIPIVDMIDAFNRSVENIVFLNRSACVFGTKLTVERGGYQRILTSKGCSAVCETIGTECEKFVANLQFGEALPEGVIRELMALPKSDYLFLACTCFSYFKTELTKYFSGKIVDLNSYLFHQSASTGKSRKGKIVLVSTDANKLNYVKKSYESLFLTSEPVVFYDWVRILKPETSILL